MRLALAVLVVGVGVARADEPLSPVVASAGVGIAWSHVDFLDLNRRGFAARPAFRLDVAYRLSPSVAIGVHAGYALAHGNSTMGLDFTPYEFDYSAVELGEMVQAVSGRWWIAPWVGVHKLIGGSDLVDDVTLGYGIAAGGSISRVGEHDVDVFVSAMHSFKTIDSSDDSFVQLTVGFDYRY